MLHKYTDNIAYLFKRITVDESLTYEVDGEIFQYNLVKKFRKHLDPISGTYITDTSMVYRTDYQLNFKMGDKIANMRIPTEDDFSVINTADDKPIHTAGNKHRTRNYFEYDLTIV